MTEFLEGPREAVFNLLHRSSCIGIELGVAAGGFSHRMVMTGKFDRCFGVDLYGGGIHSVSEYKEALRKIGVIRGTPYHLLRMTFEEAYDLFPDGWFDFIYVDGYAHGGEDGGATIYSWWRKLRVHGVMAGDDYHARWPLVVEAVDAFVKDSKTRLHLTTDVDGVDAYSRSPSWAVIKPPGAPELISPPPSLLARGRAANAAVARRRGYV